MWEGPARWTTTTTCSNYRLFTHFWFPPSPVSAVLVLNFVSGPSPPSVGCYLYAGLPVCDPTDSYEPRHLVGQCEIFKVTVLYYMYKGKRGFVRAPADSKSHRSRLDALFHLANNTYVSITNVIANANLYWHRTLLDSFTSL